jgi:hypothetical protein
LDFLDKFELFVAEARRNRWYRGFAIFCRLVLAVAFLISGVIKIRGERFAAGLPETNPMGHYLAALHETGFYYESLGWVQAFVAILLLIPRTALLGALIYFPIIMNITVLAYAVRFEGTRAATFMVLANIFLLCWDYSRLKHILPFKQPKEEVAVSATNLPLNRFPYAFFAFVVIALASVVLINHNLYLRPGNSEEECRNVCGDDKGCQAFCDCIYVNGNALGPCLEEYEKMQREQEE